jgi:hypothetical protein
VMPPMSRRPPTKVGTVSERLRRSGARRTPRTTSPQS